MVSAQTIADNWYFGYKAGIQFNLNIPSIELNGVLHTNEGCASISDDSGDLLFYTDGDTVWNRNHAVMPNGAGLLGNASSTQSAVVCPVPNSSDSFVVFTVDAGTGTGSNQGLRYSYVDMNLDAGLGDVIPTSKNIYVDSLPAEKLLAVENCARNGYWVITRTRTGSTIQSYEFTETGLSSTPQITTSLVEYDTLGEVGYARASPNKKLVAFCNARNDNVELFQFNNQSGQLYNAIRIHIPRANGAPDGGPYGCEFSPDSKKLYVTGIDVVYQFSLESLDSVAIANSKFTVASGQIFSLTALQLGPDHKIYQSFFTDLNVIHDPNETGAACDFELQGLDLLGREARSGLPNFISNYVPDHPFANDTICIEDTMRFQAHDSCMNSILWNFGDPGSGANNTSNLSNPTHLFSDTGVFTITMVVEYPIVSDTFQYEVYVTLPPDPEVLKDSAFSCQGEEIELVALQHGATYLWGDGSDSSSIFASDSGWYVVTISSPCSTLIDSVYLAWVDPLELSLGHDTTLCQNEPITLKHNLSPTSTSFLWWNGDTTSINQSNIDTAGAPATLVWLYVSNACGQVADSVNIEYYPTPNDHWFSGEILCGQSTHVVADSSEPGIVHYLTKNSIVGDTLNPWRIAEPDTYFLHSLGICDTLIKAAFLSPNQAISSDLGPDTTLCLGDSILLEANQKGATYEWSNGAIDSLQYVSEAGLYVVTITVPPCTQVDQKLVAFSADACDSVACKFNYPNVFSPNADGINDNLIITNSCSIQPFKAYVYNRWGQLVWRDNSNGSSRQLQWDGSINGLRAAEGVYYLQLEFITKTNEANIHQGSFSLIR